MDRRSRVASGRARRVTRSVPYSPTVDAASTATHHRTTVITVCGSGMSAPTATPTSMDTDNGMSSAAARIKAAWTGWARQVRASAPRLLLT